MELADTHCHLDMAAFDADRAAVLARAALAGVSYILVPALDCSSAGRILALVEAHLNLFAAVGIHPTEAKENIASDVDTLRGLAAHPKVVAIGEIGLDYYRIKDSRARARQRVALQAQLDVAQDAELPVVLHMREQADAEYGPCAADLLNILSAWTAQLRSRGSALSQRPGVLHSFSGTGEIATAAIGLGFCIGVTGPITFRNAETRRKVVRALPLDRMLIETDAPFLAPVPHRGRRNEPAFTTHIADRIAQIRSQSVRQVAEITSANAARLFRWGVSV